MASNFCASVAFFVGDSPGVPVPEDAADAWTTAKALTHSHTQSFFILPVSLFG